MPHKDWNVTGWLARSRRAQRRSMMNDLEAMSRRELLRRGGRVAAATGTASALFAAGIPLGGGAWARQETTPLPEITEIPENLKGSGEVVVCSFGGAFQEAQRNAYFKPFEELSGITVKEAEGPDISKVKAMVDTGNIEWDIVEFDRSDIINLENQGDYWEEIDQSLYDPDLDPAIFYTYSVDMLPYGTVIAYRTDAFATPPASQKDFWDVEKFAGPRSMQSGSGGLLPNLEFAVIADGVPKDEVYPIDIEQAYTSMSAIRGEVVKFWETGAQPAQMLTDNEAVMVHAWNGRIAAIQELGAPVEIVWNEGKLATDVWAIPKGSPNAANAQKFSAFITLAVPQARLSMLIPYGFVNDKSAELIPAERLAVLPTAPDIKSQMFDHNVEWWIENREAVLERWNEWILE